MIDAHHHFWRLGRGDYGFPPPGDATLYRDFNPGDLAPLLARAGVDRTILVQATDTIEETAFLLKLAEETPFVAGVVGWWAPRAEAGLDALRALPGSDRLVGVRPMLQKFDDVGWLMSPAAQDDLAAIADFGLAFDALVDARHLRAIESLCRMIPTLRVIIDHMGKPWRQPTLFEAWTSGMRALADRPNCSVKVSGYPFGAGAAPHDPADLYARLRASFGADRLVWGSDWPVVEREGGYGRAASAMRAVAPVEDHALVFHQNAASFYRLDMKRDDGAGAGHRGRRGDG